MAFCLQAAAKELSVHERTLRAWETGRSPDIEHWPRIIQFLGFEPGPEPRTPAQRLKAARHRHGLSIERAAAILDIDPSTLWWWEHDRKPHLREHRSRIAAFVGKGPTDAPVPVMLHDQGEPAVSFEPIGETIRNRRRELGLSQDQTAGMIGVNTWTVLLWEQGRYAPTPRFYPGLIRFLGRDPWPEPRTLGERLRAERLRRGLTQRQLAVLLKVDLGSLSKWEAGKHPRHDIANAKVDAFLTGRPQPRRSAQSAGPTLLS